uniref:Uncharacterized protein n=1 Tax=Ailuropoda melanoleuca TaxID=9646 RepID=A0A7N5JTH7_AILME
LWTSDGSMKLGGFFLLVMLITLSSEVQQLQAAVRPLRVLGKSGREAAGSLHEGAGEWASGDRGAQEEEGRKARRNETLVQEPP